MMITRIKSVLMLTLLLRNIEAVINSDNEIATSSGNQLIKNDPPCCTIRDHPFHSVVHALSNVTSNSIVTLVSNAVLSSVVVLKNLENVKIIGQGNPTVNCSGVGGIKFVSCNNVIIEGINWERCGSNESSCPGMQFNNATNIVIQTCSFHHSTAQAVVLSEVQGYVYINNCQFTHNKNYNGHGAAIYYTTEQNSTEVHLNHCNFALNGPAKSVVFIENMSNRVNGHISLLTNSTFIQNQGVPIFISHASIILNNRVSFKYNRAIAGGGIYSSNSIITFGDECVVSFNNNSVSTNGGAVYQIYSKLLFTMNAAVMFRNNSAVKDGGAIFSIKRSFISFEDDSEVMFNDNRAKRGAVVVRMSTIYTNGNSTVIFTGNSAILSGGAVYAKKTQITIHGSSTVAFCRNSAKNGAAVFVSGDNAFMSCGDNSTVIFTGNSATDLGGAIYMYTRNSNIAFHGHSKATFNSNSAVDGGAVYVFGPVTSYTQSYNLKILLIGNKATENDREICDLVPSITFLGSTTVRFNNNSARHYGGAMYTDKINVAFHGSSTATFSNNSAHTGGAIATSNYAMSFGGNSTITFNGNKATSNGYGGAIDAYHSKIIFHGNSTVTFSNNSANSIGGAIYAFSFFVTLLLNFEENSTVTFTGNSATSVGGAARLYGHVRYTGNSTVMFYNNTAREGGALYITFRSLHYPYEVIFQGNTNVTFINNRAIDGGAIYVSVRSGIIFQGNSFVNFCNNIASLSGGAISSQDDSNIWFTGVSTTHFNNNIARQHGGAIHSVSNTSVTFNETCCAIFTNNTAMQQGGAVYLFDKSAITFGGNSNVTYSNNTALQQGGAVYSAQQSNISFKGNSVITFKHNGVLLSGGALYSLNNGPIYFEDNCTVSFYHNMVRQDGGAIHSVNTTLYFSGGSSVTFTNNAAMQQGGAVCLFYKAAAMFQDDSNVTFKSNTAMQHGGAIYVHDNTNVSFVGSSNVLFLHNMAESGGGVLHSYHHCNIAIKQYSEVMFIENSAMRYGGAMYCDHHSDVTLEGNIPVIFTSNTAEHGGAVCISQSILKFANDSAVMFNNNRAIRNGGAMHFSNNFTATFDYGSSITFSNNIANRYGGAIYSELRDNVYSKMSFNTTGINFTGNTALIGDSVYLDIPASCDDNCLNRSIIGVYKEIVEHSHHSRQIYSPPRKLILQKPAVCIDHDVTNCGIYFIKNIMLGQNIINRGCVLDYYDQPVVETQFIVDSNDEDHTINGSNSVLMSCNGLQGISVKGSRISGRTNFSMDLTSHSGSQSDISIQLIAELSPCHPGFYYDDTTHVQRCVCYDDNDIITCSDSSSFIRRGYWFGVVDDESTVTVCPNNYCNFACCEDTKGFYQLSPARMNQCSSHRSGIACGSCEEGYTLSFDSVECVSVDKCTTGQTVLVVTLSMIYWIVIVILVFIMTYYHVGIGYLYVITYYYSILDILMGQNLYELKGLLETVTTLSSLVKITPQFLGRLCLVHNMNGIDQQFIHYTHPLAVSIIIAIICQSARLSYKFSSFISRGIIRTVCYLLLLSYTSVATTSLLLLRSLTFHNVDKVYTYLSPDIEYCHGRHLPYFIVAVLCTLVIVIGLPLVLLLEPLLNKKISFTRMKPLLDQFQGCYKDKYRCFAAYYMICRLVIIVIIIANPSNNYLSQFLLICTSVILAVIVIILRPYKHKILNIFDGLILRFVILATLIPLADNVSQQLSKATIIIVMFFPLIFFIALELIVHKDTIKIITTKITAHFKTKPAATTKDNNEVPIGDIGIVVDDNMRKNAIICEM